MGVETILHVFYSILDIFDSVLDIYVFRIKVVWGSMGSISASVENIISQGVADKN